MNIALAEVNSGLPSLLRSVVRSFHACGNRLQLRSRLQRTIPVAATPAIYQIADRLHEQRTVRVAGDAIAPTVSAWLAELGSTARWRMILHERCAAATGLLSMPLASTCRLA